MMCSDPLLYNPVRDSRAGTVLPGLYKLVLLSCFVFTLRAKLTQIVVDVSAGPYKERTVMFLGSDDGRVLKVLASTHPNDSFGSKLLEDIDVYNPSK